MLKKKFGDSVERLFLSLPVNYSSIKINPNYITTLGVIISFITFLLLWGGRFKTAGIFIIVAGLCDLLDGLIARSTFKTSHFGAFLDSTFDRISDSLIFAGLIVYYARHRETWNAVLGSFAMIVSVTIPYAKARAENFIEKCDVGILERLERLIILVIGLIFNFKTAALYIIIFAGIITIAERIMHTYFELQK